MATATAKRPAAAAGARKTQAAPGQEWPFDPEIVPLKYMHVDMTYQRKLTSFVKKIVKDFNPALVGNLTLSKRSDTHYAIIDGQTRWAALGELGRERWAATVFYGLTVEQEAELFALFQTQRRAMTSAERFNAQVRSKDPIALEITEIANGLNFKIEHNSIDPESIRAVGAMEFLFHGCRGGKSDATLARRYPALLAAVLETIRAAWPDLPDTAKGRVMLQGLGQFLYENNEAGRKIDQDKLVRILKGSPPAALGERADKLRDSKRMTGNSPRYLAEIIANDYFGR